MRLKLAVKVPQKFAISREIIKRYFYPASKEVAKVLEFAWREALFGIDAVATGVTQRAIRSSATESFIPQQRGVTGRVSQRSSLQYIGFAYARGRTENITLNVLETGRGKGKKMPPDSPEFRKWMKVRGIPDQSDMPKRRGRGRKRESEEAYSIRKEKYTKSVSFAIRRAIGRDGIKGRHPARLAKRQAVRECLEIYGRARDEFVKYFNTQESQSNKK